MKNFKRFAALVIAVVLAVASFAGCGNKNTNTSGSDISGMDAITENVMPISEEGIEISIYLDNRSRGAIASYNALITLGASRSFDDVLAFYNRRMPATLGWGFTGLMPRDIANYFTSLGYTVLITDQTSQIDTYSQSASACIMYYKFPRTYQVFNSLSINAYGAHFIEYSRLSNGYVGRNTSEGSGTYAFSSPYGYGTKGPRYYVVGVFIYK